MRRINYDLFAEDKEQRIIVVLTSTPRDGSINFNCAISDMNLIDEYGKTVNRYPHRLLFRCSRQVNDQTPEKTRQWLTFIEDSLDGEVDRQHYPNKTLVFSHHRRRLVVQRNRQLMHLALLGEASSNVPVLDKSFRLAPILILRHLLGYNGSYSSI